ncbi:MAG: VOC family protein [Tistlia sp.]|uniref:VOC family protein n=1 Tax=Tistlia sp. TaxID=3057121 RepID=UPI0034A34C2D
MAILQKITPCLWFDDQAEQAAELYVSIFPESGIEQVTRYGKEGFEVHGRPEGTVLTVSFRLAGQAFTALNGGPHFTFNEAISLVVRCESQEEVDFFWDRLGQGGPEQAQQCGWLKDRFGLSWQIVPEPLLAMLSDPDAERSGRAMTALLQMKKLDLATLQQAYEGG